jgi:hypothetical protein
MLMSAVEMDEERCKKEGNTHRFIRIFLPFLEGTIKVHATDLGERKRVDGEGEGKTEKGEEMKEEADVTVERRGAEKTISSAERKGEKKRKHFGENATENEGSTKERGHHKRDGGGRDSARGGTRACV